jgi:hypothetical protein
VGDFNGDGEPDLAVANAGTVSVLLGNGNGSFQTHVEYPAGTGGSYLLSVAVGDFNADGKLDLAISSTGYWTRDTSPYYLPGSIVVAAGKWETEDSKLKLSTHRDSFKGLL